MMVLIQFSYNTPTDDDDDNFYIFLTHLSDKTKILKT